MGCGCGGSKKGKPVGIGDPKTFWNGPQRRVKRERSKPVVAGAAKASDQT